MLVLLSAAVGAQLGCVRRAQPQRTRRLVLAQLGAPKIYVPNALPMYREDLPGRPLSKKRRAEKEAEDRKYQPAQGSAARGECAPNGAGALGWLLLPHPQRMVAGRCDGVSVARHRAALPSSSVPAAGMGAGGQIGATGGTLLTQHVLKQQGGLSNPKEEDARAAFLRHAGKTGDEIERFTSAYNKTQPDRIFHEDEEEEEEGEDK